LTTNEKENAMSILKKVALCFVASAALAGGSGSAGIVIMEFIY
jgi:hypothetical protein